MKRPNFLLLIVVTFLYNTAIYAQTKMSVIMKDGNVFEYSVSEISEMRWSDVQQDDEGNTGDLSVTGDATDITYFSAKVSAYANIMDNEATDIKVGVIYCTEGTPTKSNGTQLTVALSSISSDAKYSVSITGLNENTTYYYRSFVYQSGLWRYGKVKSFTTKSGAVVFTTGASSSVTCFSAKVAASVKVAPSVSYRTLEYGILYGTDNNPNKKLKASSKDVNGNYTVTLRALMGSTMYYYRPYAEMDGKTYYGELSTLKTLADNVVETGTADENYVVKSQLILSGGAYSTLELGLCYGREPEPTIKNNTSTTNELDDEGYYSLSIRPFFGTTYYRAYVLIDGVPHYGETRSVYKEMNVNGHDYVDLGLPSGTLWATCNVGASKPEEYGNYYAWGETAPKSTYNWSTYKWCKGSSNTMTKYCTYSDYGTVDNKTVLDPEDDAAYVNWGGDWCMPTEDEIRELNNTTYCTWSWTTQNGVYGYKVTSKSNGNSIFLPAAGDRGGSSLYYAGAGGYYWSSSLSSDYGDSAYCMGFYSGGHYWGGGRANGRTVRPVLGFAQNSQP